MSEIGKYTRPQCQYTILFVPFQHSLQCTHQTNYSHSFSFGTLCQLIRCTMYTATAVARPDIILKTQQTSLTNILKRRDRISTKINLNTWIASSPPSPSLLQLECRWTTILKKRPQWHKKTLRILTSKMTLNYFPMIRPQSHRTIPGQKWPEWP